MPNLMKVNKCPKQNNIKTHPKALIKHPGDSLVIDGPLKLNPFQPPKYSPKKRQAKLNIYAIVNLNK